MGFMSFLGAAERQINPFDNNKTASNPQGNKGKGTDAGSKAFNFLSNAANPIVGAGEGLVKSATKIATVPINAVRTGVADLTNNQAAEQHASELTHSGLHELRTLAQAPIRGLVQLGITPGATGNASGGEEQVATSPISKFLYGAEPIPTLQKQYSDTKKQTGSTTQAVTGTALSLFSDVAGAKGGIKTAGKVVNHLADTSKMVTQALGDRSQALGENGFLNLSNSANKHPVVQALNSKLDELNQKRDQLSSQGASKSVLNQNAKAYRSVLQAKQNAIRKIVQGGYIGDEAPKPITTDDINTLAKAPDEAAVKTTLQGKAAPATIDKIAPAIAATKDPHIISDIVQKNTPPEVPVDTTVAPGVTPAPKISELAGANSRPNADLQAKIEAAHNAGDKPTVAALVSKLPPEDQPAMRSALGILEPSIENGIQSLSNVAKNSKNFADFQKNFEALPSHPDLQAAVDTVAPHQTLEDFYNSLTGKTPAVDTSVAPGTTPAAAPKINTPQQQVIDALYSKEGEKGASQIRAQQEKGYAAERSARISASQGAGKDLQGTQGYYAELAQLKGELPKEEYSGLSNKLNPKEQEDLFTKLRGELQQNPDISGYSAINVQGALRKVIFGEGGVPTTSEIKLLKNAFGDDFSNAVKEDVSQHNERVSTARKLYNTVSEVAGVPRALMASVDFSGGLRQGLAAATRHPIVFAQAFAKQFGNFLSEGKYQEAQAAIEHHQNFPLMQRAGLAIQDIGNTTTKASQREEQFVSGLAEKIPVVGDLVHASERAYVGLLNNMRANIFNQLVETSKKAGINLEDPVNVKILKQIGEVVNTSTGRGSLGALEGAAQELSTGLFAPRLIASRVQMLNPQYYIKLNPIARREALTTLLSLGAFGTTVLSAAALGGAKVETDPTSSDFGKIKIGDTRLDVLGGFQQYIRLGAQLATGRSTSSVTGANQTLGKGIAATRFDVLTRFLTNKEAPVPSFITTLLRGKDAAGNPVDVPREIWTRFVPLIGQDIRDLLTHKDSAGPAAAIPGIFGVGLQTYGKQDIQANPKQQKYLDTLQQEGASKETIEGATSFFQNLKVAGGTRQNVSDSINKALESGNIQKAQQLAQDYNKKYAAGFKDWVAQYGKTVTDPQLVKTYNSQKINLTATDIRNRIKSINDKKAGKL